MKKKIEKIDDDMLIESIDRHMRNATGGNTNSSDVSKRRENAVYEMSLEAQGDLKPQGVSSIVSSDSAEIAEGYTALLTKLLLDNNKLALFTPYSNEMAAIKASQVASDVVNYCLFNSNPDGWSKLSTWIKSAVVFGNSALTWGWEEKFDYVVEEYEQIEEGALDQILADANVEIIGELQIGEDPIINDDGTSYFAYIDVRLRRKIDKSGVKLSTIPPESFLIDRSATSVTDATFVGVVTEMTRSDIRITFGDHIDLDEIGEEATTRSSSFSYEAFARKDAAGIQNFITNSDADEEEANMSITVIECWIRSDRDGDGIAELKHVIKAGNTILSEDDVAYVPVAVLNPIEIPHEFYGLSLLDMARPQTQATTAILRGFVENVYFGNYGRTLADPNVVDFQALQNPVPKQIIPTNGNPAAAVQQLQPEPMSSGTAGMLEFLGLQKEQSTGLSKTAMGLNDTLYVSGNSEQKMAGAQNAAQIRVEHIARRFVETGIKDLCRGVLREMKSNLKNPSMYKTDKGYASLTPQELQTMPGNMDLDIQANIGENSNFSVAEKLMQLTQLLPQMAQSDQSKAYVNPLSSYNLALDIVKNMGMDPTRFLNDPNSQEFQQAQQESQQKQQAKNQKLEQAEEASIQLELATKQANVSLIKAESDNKKIDNKRQLLSAHDDSSREWAELAVKAVKDGVQPPPHEPADFMSLYQDTEEREAQQAQEEQMMQQQGMHQMPDGTMMPNSEMEEGAGGYEQQNNADSTGY
tara:strand:+ start:1143 stop:3401 length:2259 start_codon:yes stop_codon:yes gene_type:complete